MRVPFAVPWSKTSSQWPVLHNVEQRRSMPTGSWKLADVPALAGALDSQGVPVRLGEEGVEQHSTETDPSLSLIAILI